MNITAANTLTLTKPSRYSTDHKAVLCGATRLIESGKVAHGCGGVLIGNSSLLWARKSGWHGRTVTCPICGTKNRLELD